MLKVRLQRVGRKNDPSFRVVLTDSKNSTKSGRFLEVLGSYNARFGKPEIKGDRVKYWMSVGALLTPTVHNLMLKEKVIEGKKINVLPRKSPPKKEEVAETKGESAGAAPEVTATPAEAPKEESPKEAEAETPSQA